MTAPLPIYFNGKFYSGGLNGVHRVADRLIRECDRELARLPEDERPDAFLMTSGKADWVPDLQVIKRRNYTRTDQIWEQFVLPFAARSGILVNLANLAPIAHRNKITMIHDAQFLFSDCGYPARQRLGYRWLTPMLGRSSRATLTVSEFSRRMLHQFSVVNEKQTHVIANGADHILDVEEDPGVRARLGIEGESYAVMFGSPKGYKNNATPFAAFADGRLSPTRLVIVGPERAQLEAAGLTPPDGTIFAGKLNDRELKGVLAGGLAILFPSRTEGFGLPPLEAMLCGCPVLASPAGAIPEVCADAAIYAGTDRPGEWIEAIEIMRSDPQLRQRKIAEGYARAARFTWSGAGASLMNVIHALAGEKLQ
ncbi:glycosyltransferase family 4 protein [Novosphingobium beihaiensis]|uniref:Glycosyltransferase family 4 protein n=1 Tax=Novosphingobium beihaiensis TaxID=2930389 RepID=A0ABT0BTK4_9SPHN|nr:glycosyltransferase family 1 protein [Novosphingobium beihaiensis]MCJ2188389.1 glycosyltransferase family 4 protein [Novosphingobium beihaiensis]